MFPIIPTFGPTLDAPKFAPNINVLPYLHFVNVK